jgi:hypothetical protein
MSDLGDKSFEGFVAKARSAPRYQFDILEKILYSNEQACSKLRTASRIQSNQPSRDVDNKMN